MSVEKKPGETVVVLYQGDDWDRLDELNAAMRAAAAERSLDSIAPRRMGDEDPYVTAKREFEEFEKEARERAVHLRLDTIPWRQYQALLEKHLPREDERSPDVTNPDGSITRGEVVKSHPMDTQLGFNVSTMGPDLVPLCVAMEGQFDSEADRDAFLDGLSMREWQRVYGAAIRHNQAGGPDPKDFDFSRLDRMLDAISD